MFLGPLFRLQSYSFRLPPSIGSLRVLHELSSITPTPRLFDPSTQTCHLSTRPVRRDAQISDELFKQVECLLSFAAICNQACLPHHDCGVAEPWLQSGQPPWTRARPPPAVTWTSKGTRGTKRPQLRSGRKMTIVELASRHTWWAARP